MRSAPAGSAPAAADGLPFIDEHSLTVDARVDEVWARLTAYVGRELCRRDRGVFERLLGTAAPGGFEVAASEPPTRLVLAGRHRFARYVLDFVLTGEGDGTRLSARSFARFPGVRGRLYRLAVIRSGVHVVATRRLLRAIAGVA